MYKQDNDPNIKRLIVNQRNLLETIPEMVLLVKGSESVEYMNPSARLFFGNLCQKPKDISPAHSQNSKTLLNIVAMAIENDTIGPALETPFNQSHLEYTLAPFEGYDGDALFWLFLRDQSEVKAQFEELSLFHNSIETILSHKIHELKESEKMRRTLSSELNSLKEHLKERPEEGKMVGSSRALTELRDMVFQVAKSDATILITGESGTGKELVANLIRESSGRNEKPF